MEWKRIHTNILKGAIQYHAFLAETSGNQTFCNIGMIIQNSELLRFGTSLRTISQPVNRSSAASSIF